MIPSILGVVQPIKFAVSLKGPSHDSALLMIGLAGLKSLNGLEEFTGRFSLTLGPILQVLKVFHGVHPFIRSFSPYTYNYRRIWILCQVVNLRFYKVRESHRLLF